MLGKATPRLILQKIGKGLNHQTTLGDLPPSTPANESKF